MSIKLFFFGDSICVGQNISVHNTWVCKISAQLEKDFPKVQVSNASINGNTTRMALERFHFDVLCQLPDIVYIQFGLNDCNVWKSENGYPRVPIGSYISNLREMIERSKLFGVKRIFINSNHRCSLTKRFCNEGLDFEERNKRYYENLKEGFPSDPSITFLDIRQYLKKEGSDPKDYLLGDGVHLNLRGHELYFTYIYILLFLTQF